MVHGSKVFGKDSRNDHISRFQRSVDLALPTRPDGPGYYIWRLRRSSRRMRLAI